MLKNKKGITLVALVVTIVVLLILAGVSINLVLGNNGIIVKAREAQKKPYFSPSIKIPRLHFNAKLQKNKEEIHIFLCISSILLEILPLIPRIQSPQKNFLSLCFILSSYDIPEIPRQVLRGHLRQ